MRNIKLTIQYDGTKYKGWQRQSDSDMTIQGKLESVISRMTGENIEVTGSGRTDAGVHAENQIANFKTKSDMSLEDMLNYCYLYLPEDIVIKNAEEVPDLFHSRYNAKGKIYMYRICNNTYHNVFDRKYTYHIQGHLNINLMKEASEYFIGEHDFQSFTTLKSKKKSTIRNIYDIDIKQKDGYINIIFRGNGFLYNMVRIITGTLIEVGAGRMKKEELLSIMDQKNRSLAGPTAPAQGLFLMKVIF